MSKIVLKGNNLIENNISSEITFNNNNLNIPNNLELENTIKILLTERSNNDLTINVGSNVNAKILVEIEESIKTKVSYNIRLNVLDNSHINYLLLTSLESEDADITNDIYAHNDATVNVYGSFLTNILNARLNCELIGRGSTIDVKTVTVSSDEHSQQVDVYMHNNAPNSNGYMTSIAIANKKGRVILNGIEKIEKGMKNSDVYQTLKGIITSDDSYIEVNPILLINEYDLEAAGHAATVGKLEEEQLFYLMSRGLSLEDAEKLIVQGFLRPVLDEIEDEELRNKIVELIDKRI